MYLEIIYLIFMYEKELALIHLQRLIKPNQTTPNYQWTQLNLGIVLLDIWFRYMSLDNISLMNYVFVCFFFNMNAYIGIMQIYI